MGFRLAAPGDALTTGFVKRFDARFWTVDFPRPMMASVVTTAPDALRVDGVFYRRSDLAGLIWAAEDRFDHPLLAYATDRDFRGCRLRFRWRSAGLKPLDAVDGPTLTIEGRDADGHPRAWYVRLWNYASGSPQDAEIAIDFGEATGGFLLPDEADPVWAGDVDRMFVSLVAPGFDRSDAPLEAPVEGWVELSGIACEGPGSVLAIGEAVVPEHGLRIATGYDDAYNVTPERLLRNALQLGYRGPIDHYVGMSHYFRLAHDAGSGGWFVSLGATALNAPCSRWHADFVARAKGLGYGPIVSLSYELLDQHCWGDWKQRTADGSPALTGWSPPSTLLSPAHGGAMAYLRAVAAEFAAILADAGLPVRFQIGEPWWWTMPDGRPCLYDAASVAAFGGAPPAIASVRTALDEAQIALLDQAGALLAGSTLALRDAVRAVAPASEVLLLAYLPTVLDPAAPELVRANLPLGWASPAFDRLQLEDYDWVTAGDTGATARGVEEATTRLGYPVEETHYFAGFVAEAGSAAADWPRIEAAIDAARVRGSAETFVWALPQVIRDGLVHWDEEGDVDAFDDVSFPLAIGREARVEPGFSTAIVTSAGGQEQRNAEWADARLRFDAGPGVRSETDIGTLIGFFRARRGRAKGFRFRDPFDSSSNGMSGDPSALDQRLGVGDGATTGFALVKRYADGDQPRRITRPVAGSALVAIDGAARASGWSLAPGGMVVFDTAPPVGAAVTAGFRFDVPVRFEEDRLEVSRATYLAGEAASVPLIEVREG